MTYLEISKKEMIEVKKGSRGKPIICEQTGLYMESASKMASTMGISYPLLMKHLSGRCGHAHGYTFRYCSDDEIKEATK